MGCASPPARTSERVAFLNLENLTGDPALDWMARAVPAMAVNQLTGTGSIFPAHADTSRDAANLRATQLVHGYFDRRKGAVHFEFQVEDADTHQMRPLSVDGNVLQVASAAAQAVGPSAREFSSRSLPAIEAWAKGDFEQATQLDPEFGTAWRDWLRTRPSPEIAARARSRSPIETAEIQLIAARLKNDDAAAGQAALELGKLVPKDTALLRRLAEQAARSPQSAELYKLALAQEPGDKALYNQLGYAQFFAGDLEGARKSFDEYGKAPGQEANAHDSQGEVLFMAGRFAEAETYFLKAHQVDPRMLNGGDLLKAAYARWFAGNASGADQLFAEYLKDRAARRDNPQPAESKLLEQVWLYSTGRPAALPVADSAKARLLAQDLRVLESLYRQTAPAGDGLPRILYAKALLKAGRKAEAEALARRWPLPEMGDAMLQAVLFPLYLELQQDLRK